MKTGYLIRLVLTLILLTHAELRAAPQLATANERIAFAEALLEKYPNILRHNLQFRQNLMESMRRIDDATKRLGEHVNATDNRRLSIMELSYSPEGEVGYDLQTVGALKESLLIDLSKHTFDGELRVEQALANLRERSTENGTLNVEAYKRSLRGLMRILPLLFDAEGQAIASTLESATLRLRGLNPGDIDNLYNDTFLLHQAEIVQGAADQSKSPDWVGTKRGDWTEALRVTREHFIKKTVGQALAPISTARAGQVMAPRYLRIEEVITPVDVFRGCFGKDCSILSVPLYPLVEGTKTYFISKSAAAESQPDGYALVAPVEVDGKVIPYIITINGNLSAADAAKVIQAIALDWHTDQYVYPDLKRTPHLVNPDAMRVGMAGKSPKALSVKMPEGWAVISKYLDENKIPNYPNYYAEAKLTPAFVARVQVHTSDLAKPISKNIYLGTPLIATGQIRQLRVLDRALLAGNIVQNSGDPALLETLQARYDLSLVQISVAQKLADGIAAGTVLPETYHSANQHLGFGFRDLKDLDIMTRLSAYNTLSQAAPEIASVEEWQSTYTKVWADVGKEWAQTPEGEKLDVYHSLVEPFSLSVPAEFRNPPETLRSSLVSWAMAKDQPPYALFSETEIRDLLPGILEEHVPEHFTIRAEDIVFIIERLAKYPPRWSEDTTTKVWDTLALKIDHLGSKNTGLQLLRKIPAEHRTKLWLSAAINHIGFINSRDQTGRAGDSVLREMVRETNAFQSTHPGVVTGEVDGHLLENITYRLNTGTNEYFLPAIFEALSNPKYRKSIEKDFLGDSLKTKLFQMAHRKWLYRGGYPESLVAFERLGFIEEYRQYVENIADKPDFLFSPFELKAALADAELSNASKDFLIGFLKTSAWSVQQMARIGGADGELAYRQNYDSRLEDLFDPNLRAMIGEPAHDQLLVMLREDLDGPYFTKLGKNRKQEFLAKIQAYAAASPYPEVATQLHAMLNEQKGLAKLLRPLTRILPDNANQRCMKIIRQISGAIPAP